MPCEHMPSDATPVLAWIDQQQPRMRQLITRWAAINSGSHNLDGLDRFSRVLQQHYSALGGELAEIPLPPQQVIDDRGNEVDVPLGRAISIRKRPEAPHRVF